MDDGVFFDAEFNDSFADLTKDKIEMLLKLADKMNALENRVSRVEKILHEVVSDTYKNNIRLIAQPPRSKPRDFHNGLEVVLKGLLDMPNVIKVRAGLRHVDVELGIFYNIRKR